MHREGVCSSPLSSLLCCSWQLQPCMVLLFGRPAPPPSFLAGLEEDPFQVSGATQPAGVRCLGDLTNPGILDPHPAHVLKVLSTVLQGLPESERALTWSCSLAPSAEEVR